MLKSIATLTGIRAKKWVGAHLSAAGGPHNAIESAMQVGASAFALFLKSQRRWDNPPMAPSVAKLFMENGTQNGFIPVNPTAPLTIPVSQRILPHGSYLINLANADAEKRQKSFENFVDDLKRCEACHIGLYNFHPGSTVGSCSEEEGIRFIAEAINRAHEETSFVTIVLENMAGQGHVLGKTFAELRAMISLVKDKMRVGVCLDTCHLYSAGYDIRTAASFEKVMQEFDRIIGPQYLKALHLNDSKAAFDSKKDRHEKIGKGTIGLEAFRYIMMSPRFNYMPLILETPLLHGEKDDYYAKEIELLYSLAGDKED